MALFCCVFPQSDNLLLEMGFLSLFFPSLDSSAGAWSLVSQPLPILTFSVQCLLARMVIGSATSKVSEQVRVDEGGNSCLGVLALVSSADLVCFGFVFPCEC